LRIAEAVFEVEAAVQARESSGCVTDIEALGCEVAGCDCVVVYVWFQGDADPLTLIVDLQDEPVTEESCDAILAALRGTSTAASVH
jgi:hypothetical protein